MAKLTVEQYQAKLNRQIEEVRKDNKPLFLGASTGVAIMAERIFEDGRDANNGKIGNYSTKPIYISPDNSPRSFSPVGKTGKSQFQSGKPHKTRYFGGGYKGFRSFIGRESSFVNLRLTNDLQSDFSNSLIPKTSNKVAAEPKPTKISNDRYEINLNSLNAKKVSSLEKKYGKKIFRHTKDERKEILKVVGFELFKILND